MNMAVTPSTTLRPKIRRTHISLFVRDPFASAPWYEEVLGMQETARGAQWRAYGDRQRS